MCNSGMCWECMKEIAMVVLYSRCCVQEGVGSKEGCQIMPKR
jgi:hypothetical protein